MQKIVFKKSWVERMDNMDRDIRHRCIIALYEFLFFGRITPPGLRGGSQVYQFMRSIADEVAVDEERRERMRKRREANAAARAAKAAVEKENQVEETPQPEPAQPATVDQPVFKSIDYAAHPEMYIIEGFLKYLAATGDRQFTSVMPKGMPLNSLEQSLHHCFTTGQRYSNITRLTSTMRSQFRHTIRQCIMHNS